MFSLLHTAIDSTVEGEGPVYNYRPFVAPYFIAFIIVMMNCLSKTFVDLLFVYFKGHCIFYGQYFRRFCHRYISK